MAFENWGYGRFVAAMAAVAFSVSACSGYAIMWHPTATAIMVTMVVGIVVFVDLATKLRKFLRKDRAKHVRSADTHTDQKRIGR